MASNQASKLAAATSNSSRGIATVQTEQVESPALLPSLDALEAEFGCEDEPCATGRRRQGGAPMDAKLTPPQSEFPRDLRATGPTGDGVNQSSLEATIMRPSLRQASLARACPFVDRFLRGCWHHFGLAGIW